MSVVKMRVTKTGLHEGLLLLRVQVEPHPQADSGGRIGSERRARPHQEVGMVIPRIGEDPEGGLGAVSSGVEDWRGLCLLIASLS